MRNREEGRQSDWRLLESPQLAKKTCLDKRIFSRLMCEPPLKSAINPASILDFVIGRTLWDPNGKNSFWLDFSSFEWATEAAMARGLPPQNPVAPFRVCPLGALEAVLGPRRVFGNWEVVSLASCAGESIGHVFKPSEIHRCAGTDGMKTTRNEICTFLNWLWSTNPKHLQS